MLRAPTRRRERILLYGPPGAGKSTAWLTLAEWIHKTKSDAIVHVADTDRTWDDMAPYDDHLEKIVDVTDCPAWEQIRQFIRDVPIDLAKADDWLVVDMISRCWDRAQEGYFEKVFGREMDEFFMQVQADRAKAIGGDFGSNWQAINKMYATLTTLIMSRWPGHVLCCTPAQRIWEANRDDKTLVQYPEFGRLGFKPQGQKDLSHQFRTILFMQQAPSGWVWSTAKERNPPGMEEGQAGYRGYVAGERMNDFVRDYLMKVGGWRP